MNELKQMSPERLRELWRRHFQNDARPQLRPLCYKIQCARTGQKVGQRHLTRLNKYAASPELCASRANQTKYRIKPGTRLIKKYKGREHIIEALGNDTFRYNSAIYKTLSAIAMVITGHKVSGYDFFGLYTKRSKE